MTMKKAQCGRLGGLNTYYRYGREGMVARAKKGGRPRALTLKDLLRQLSEAEVNKEKQEELDTPQDSASLTTLRRLWRRRSSGNTNKQEQAG